MNTIGIYVHIPFCLRKCAYCDFVSYPHRLSDIDRYIDALIEEAKIYSGVLKKRTADTVFIGGGTPSLLSVRQTERIIRTLQSVCRWNNPEVTMEANPETLDEDKLSGYASLGVSRLSIGLQTHDDDVLENIGRGHTWDVFERAYYAAAKCFFNINVDLIFGLPGQTLENFQETIRRVVSLSPQHISVYALKLEAGTPLASRFSGADEDTDRKMYHFAAEILCGAGYRHYETSNFAKPGFECRHNLKYWTGEEYLGLGTAAHSCLNEDGFRRFANTTDLDMYMDRAEKKQKPVAEEEVLNRDGLIFEYIMLRLRLKAGINFEDYHMRFCGNFLADFKDAIQKTRDAGLITQDGKGIYPTLKGFDLQNALISEYIKNM